MSSAEDQITSGVATLDVSGTTPSAPPTNANTIYVDEIAGSDATGNGTEAAPYFTAVAALIAHGVDASLFVRKAAGEPYAQIGGTALKKAKKGVEVHEKKAKKAAEQKDKLEKEASEAKAREEKKIADSKKIVLVEDPALPIAIKVCSMKLHDDVPL